MVMEFPYHKEVMGTSDPDPLIKSGVPYKTEPRMGLSEHITQEAAERMLLDYLDTEPGFLNAPMDIRAKRFQSFIAVGVFGLIAYAFERGKEKDSREAIAIAEDAQGEWFSVTKTYAPAWTHPYKAIIDLLV